MYSFFGCNAALNKLIATQTVISTAVCFLVRKMRTRQKKRRNTTTATKYEENKKELYREY